MENAISALFSGIIASVFSIANLVVWILIYKTLKQIAKKL